MATQTRSGNGEHNVQIVLNAFNSLFNKRDYAAAEQDWSARYIQHSAHIPPGREGLFGMIKIMPQTLRYENHLAAASGDFVILHGRFIGFGPAAWVVADIRAHGERAEGRALGRHPGRGHGRAVAQWPADVRRQVSGVIQIRKRLLSIVAVSPSLRRSHLHHGYAECRDEPASQRQCPAVGRCRCRSN